MVSSSQSFSPPLFPLLLSLLLSPHLFLLPLLVLLPLLFVLPSSV